MAPLRKTPLLLLTGFLGTGKTTLLRRWIREPEFHGAMVIVNELGEVGIDQQLLGAGAEQPRLLENGCACCEGAADVASMLEDLFYDRLHRNIPDFSWVLLETTGLADPGPILDLLAESELVRERYDVAGIVTTFDARSGLQQVEAYPEILRQLQSASLVLLTRCDVAAERDVAAARQLIERVNPFAPILHSAGANVAAQDLLAVLPDFGGRLSISGPAQHTRDVTTAFLALPDSLSMAALRSALTQAAQMQRGELLRVKGVVRLIGQDAAHVVQVTAVGDVQIEPADFGTGAAPFGLTLILKGAPAQAMAETLASNLSFRGLKRLGAGSESSPLTPI